VCNVTLRIVQSVESSFSTSDLNASWSKGNVLNEIPKSVSLLPLLTALIVSNLCEGGLYNNGKRENKKFLGPKALLSLGVRLEQPSVKLCFCYELNKTYLGRERFLTTWACQ